VSVLAGCGLCFVLDDDLLFLCCIVLLVWFAWGEFDLGWVLDLVFVVGCVVRFGCGF